MWRDQPFSKKTGQQIERVGRGIWTKFEKGKVGSIGALYKIGSSSLS